MLRILAQTGDLINLAPDYTLHRDSLEKAKETLVNEIRHNGAMETARFRDLLGIGRKTAIYILEYFDKTGVTKRKENTRVIATDKID
jgi:selenocysteine-specific elongation factor